MIQFVRKSEIIATEIAQRKAIFLVISSASLSMFRDKPIASAAPALDTGTLLHSLWRDMLPGSNQRHGPYFCFV